jgi:uncharacterized damage-inducible protein DinB
LRIFGFAPRQFRRWAASLKLKRCSKKGQIEYNLTEFVGRNVWRRLKMLKKTLEDYRQGATGALMDEYERAAFELKFILQNVSEEDYTRIADAKTENEDCRSIQTIMNHVVRAGYGYADYIREQFSMKVKPFENRWFAHQEIGGEIDKMLAYTIETFDGNWELSDEEMNKIVIHSAENFTETLEQLLEHAIVHVLRHRAKKAQPLQNTCRSLQDRREHELFAKT